MAVVGGFRRLRPLHNPPALSNQSPSLVLEAGSIHIWSGALVREDGGHVILVYIILPAELRFVTSHQGGNRCAVSVTQDWVLNRMMRSEFGR